MNLKVLLTVMSLGLIFILIPNISKASNKEVATIASFNLPIKARRAINKIQRKTRRKKSKMARKTRKRDLVRQSPKDRL